MRFCRVVSLTDGPGCAVAALFRLSRQIDGEHRAAAQVVLYSQNALQKGERLAGDRQAGPDAAYVLALLRGRRREARLHRPPLSWMPGP